MRKYTIVFVCFVFSTIIALPISTQEKAPTDKLQTVCVETINSLLVFMSQIYELDKNVQNRLLRTRLANTRLIYHDAKTVCDSSWKHNGTSSVETGKDFWILSMDTGHCFDQDKSTEKRCESTLATRLAVRIKPNSEMLEWMRARDEYVDYSRNPIKDRLLTLNVSGRIDSFIQSTSGCDSLTSNNCFSLELALVEISAEKLKIGDRCSDGGFTGTLREQINLLVKETAKWVKFYMGKGEKPKRLFSSN